jgi:hypothetical protein
VNNITIELEYDQIETIVQKELRELIETQHEWYKKPDKKLLKAARLVHNFYSATEDHL